MAIIPCIAVGAVLAEDFRMHRWTIDGGGHMRSVAGGYELSGTFGQPDTEVMVAGDLELSGGFWFALVPCDCNEDGGVDLIDYADFEACVTGPEGPLPDPSCMCFDIDSDGDVDLLDVAAFGTAFSGGPL
jgi:hypothetical protein